MRDVVETAEFHDLYRKHAPDVFRFALYLSGNRSDAEDITSETFVRAWASSSSFKAETMKGFLFSIARNYFLVGRRKRAQHDEVGEDLSDSKPGPALQAQNKSELRAVLLRLRQLSESERSALVLRAWEGMSYREISNVLGISTSSAKVKVHRARIALADIRVTKG